MYKVTDHADFDAGVKEYAVDTIAELAELTGSMGSTAFVFEDLSFYMKDGQGVWRKVG